MNTSYTYATLLSLIRGIKAVIRCCKAIKTLNRCMKGLRGVVTYLLCTWTTFLEGQSVFHCPFVHDYNDQSTWNILPDVFDSNKFIIQYYTLLPQCYVITLSVKNIYFYNNSVIHYTP